MWSRDNESRLYFVPGNFLRVTLIFDWKFLNSFKINNNNSNDNNNNNNNSLFSQVSELTTCGSYIQLQTNSTMAASY